jgi:DMSO reductase anchor subunit
MIKSFLKSVSEGLFSLYVYYSNLLIGWQLVSFIYLYQSTNAAEILNRLENWSVFQPYLIGIGALITILLLISHRISPIIQLQHIQGLPKQIMVQNIFLVILFLTYLTIVLKIHLDVFELISFIFAIWVLKRWGSVFYHSRRVEWRHPTTYGSFFVAALLNGCALLSILNLTGLESINLQLFLLILLVFDLFIVYARFQYLSKSGETTNRIARKLMGTKILYFGSRIIIGIFMPAIFIIYMILITGEEIKGVELLILVGTMLDRFLFVNSVDMRF